MLIKWIPICSCLVVTRGQAWGDAALSPSIYEEPQHLNASIYARNSEPPRLLFKFRRTATRSGPTLNVLREYLYPDGRPAAREEVVYEGNALKSYQLEELQTGNIGTARLNEDARDPSRVRIAFQYIKDSSQKARTKLTTEAAGAEILINDMVGVFLSANYDKLAAGQKLNCQYVVVSRKEAVGLSFTKQSETTYHGHEAVILKLKPTNPMISVLVDPLYFTVEKAAPHHVFEYVGRTTPKINEGGHWKDLDALTIFDW